MFSSGYRQRPSVPLRLEQLETRLVPSAVAFSNPNNGPVINAPEVYSIYNSNIGSNNIATDNNVMQIVVNQLLPLLQASYGVGAGARTDGWQIGSAGGASVLTDSVIQTALKNIIQFDPGVPQPSASQCYIIYLAPGQDSNLQYDADGDRIADAYHSSFQLGNQIVPYEVISGDEQDDIPQLAAHELAETITDPTGQSWVTTQPLLLQNGQWVVSSSGQRQEIGDIFESFINAAFYLPDATGAQYLFKAMSDKNGNMILPQASSPPPSPSPAPSSGPTNGQGNPTPISFIDAIFTLYIDGAEEGLHGDSPALEQSIQANLPWATFLGFNIGDLVLSLGEQAATNALHGNQSSNGS